MNILGIDTSFADFTSVGISFDDGVCTEINAKIPFSQEEKLLSMVDSLLSTSKKGLKDIDLFAVGIGPGSFTGIRIGIATVSGLAYSLGKEIMGLSTLELMAFTFAQTCPNPDFLIVPIIDARMGRVFTALFRGSERLWDDRDITPAELCEELMQKNERLVLIGDGVKKYATIWESLGEKITASYPNFAISGDAICRYANLLYPSGAGKATPEPIYLRKSEAEAKRDEKNQK